MGLNEQISSGKSLMKGSSYELHHLTAYGSLALSAQTLAQFAATNDDVRAVLKSDESSAQAAARITELGFPISAPTVRGYRQAQRLNKNVLASPYPAGVKPPTFHSRGSATWNAGFDLGPDDGEIRTTPRPVTPDYEPPADADLLAEAELDPAVWEVTAARKSRWQAQTADGIEWMEAFRVSVKPRAAQPERLTETQVEEILGRYPRPQPGQANSRALVAAVGDLQVGKENDKGGGTKVLLETFGRVTEAVADRIRGSEHGRVETLLLPWLGDCLEGVVSQGGRLAARLDLSVTEQVRVYRRLMMHQLGVLAPLADRVIVPVVPGNHDETYRVLDMPVTDSWAIEGASAVQDALSLSADYGHVQFIYPRAEELVIPLKVGGVRIACTHGHLARNANSVGTWWSNQAYGRQVAGDADLLLTGHFHHFRAENTGGRWWCQVPALDGAGSDYFRRRTGEDAQTGMVSFWLTMGTVPWTDIRIHG